MGLEMSKIHQGFTVKVAWGRKGALLSKKCAFCEKCIFAPFLTFHQKHFLRKKCFFVKFRFWSAIPNFFGLKCTFPVLGLQKTSQKLVFIKGYAQGGPKVAYKMESAWVAESCTI